MGLFSRIPLFSLASLTKEYSLGTTYFVRRVRQLLSQSGPLTWHYKRKSVVSSAYLGKSEAPPERSPFLCRHEQIRYTTNSSSSLLSDLVE